jgi:hypothetical protein
VLGVVRDEDGNRPLIGFDRRHTRFELFGNIGVWVRWCWDVA